MPTTQSPPEAVTAPEKPLNYRFSVLFTAFARFFRGFLLFVVIILVNAAIQTALVGFFDPVPGLSAVFIITVLISFVVLVASFYFLNITALTVATQKPKFATVFRRSAGQWGRFVLWSVVMYLLVLLGLIVNTYLGLAVLLVLPFVTLAAADDQRNPLAINFRVIGGRAVRYIITAVILGIILIISNLLTSVNGFFIGGWLGALITWLYWGLLASWYLTALALIYRSTRAGAVKSD